MMGMNEQPNEGKSLHLRCEVYPPTITAQIQQKEIEIEEVQWCLMCDVGVWVEAFHNPLIMVPILTYCKPK